jgi:hypothetical protein
MLTDQAGFMQSSSRTAFLTLVLVQAAHSIEEYVTGLYEVFAPARFVSGLVSDDLATGFLVVNAALVAFGLWCYAMPVRARWPSSRGFMWFWALLELGNGVGHLLLALSRGGYFSGAATAPCLILVALALGILLLRASPSSARA